MHAGQEQTRLLTRENVFQRIRQIMTADIPTPDAPKAVVAKARLLLQVFLRIPGDFMTCTAMYGNGAGIYTARMPTGNIHPKTPYMRKKVIRSGFIAGGAGSATGATAVPPIETGMFPISDILISGFGL